MLIRFQFGRIWGRLSVEMYCNTIRLQVVMHLRFSK